MRQCRQCGAPTAEEFCAHCAVWFAPPPEPQPEPGPEDRPEEFDPYATLPSTRPGPGGREGRWRIAVVASLAVIGLAAAVGLALLFLGGPEQAQVASPAPRPTRTKAEPTPTPTPRPTVVVTVTQTPSTAPATQPSPEAPPPEPTEAPEPPVVDDPPPAPVEQRFDRFYPLGRGDGGYVVAALQGLLGSHGVRTFVDGDFGSATERSVRQWQAQQGLSVTGIVDDTTWETLTPELHQGDSGGAVQVLQALLNDRGYATIIDGDYGEQTAAAVRAFQSDRGLTVDGYVGSESWPALLA